MDEEEEEKERGEKKCEKGIHTAFVSPQVFILGQIFLSLCELGSYLSSIKEFLNWVLSIFVVFDVYQLKCHIGLLSFFLMTEFPPPLLPRLWFQSLLFLLP